MKVCTIETKSKRRYETTTLVSVERRKFVQLKLGKIIEEAMRQRFQLKDVSLYN